MRINWKFWTWKIFKKRSGGGGQSLPSHENPIPSAPVELSKCDVVLVRPHNEGKQGATAYDKKTTEWGMMGIVLPLVQELLALKGITSVILERPSGVSYWRECASVKKRAKKLNPKLALLAHFNAMSKIIYGCEVLITETATIFDNLLGDIISDGLNEKWNIKERGNDGLKIISDSHNGSGMLNVFNEIDVPCALVECAFMNKETHESRSILENLPEYAKILADALEETLRQKRGIEIAQMDYMESGSPTL